MNCSLFAFKFTVKSTSESICVYYTNSFLKNTGTSQGKEDYTVWQLKIMNIFCLWNGIYGITLKLLQFKHKVVSVLIVTNVLFFTGSNQLKTLQEYLLILPAIF